MRWGDGETTGKDPWVRMSPVLIPVASTAGTWWVVGDLTPTRFDAEHYDYIAQPSQWVVSSESWWGPLAVVAWLVVTVSLIWRRRLGPLPRGTEIRAGLMTASGVIIGGGLRVVTAGTVGANIGGGAVIVMAPTLVLVLAVVAWRAGIHSEDHVDWLRPPAVPLARANDESPGPA